jgi:cytidylate kinase
MIVTIDGSAGSGKSTAARRLAARLDIAYLDTGAMYRAIGYQILREGVCRDDAPAMFEIARSVDLGVTCTPNGTRISVNGHDVTDEIRTIAVSQAASSVAVVQEIRNLLVHKQREIGTALQSFVAEGRDQGSVVFPYADVKFVIEAAPELRARRRLQELQADNHDVTFEEVLADVKRRDERDAIQWEPLLRSGEAIMIDTTDLSLDQVVDRLEASVRERFAKRGPTC